MMKNIILYGLIIILSCFVVNAQKTEKTILNGRVMDTTGASAPGHKIKFQNEKGEAFETETDADGLYSIKLSVENYSIEIEAAGGLFGTKFANYKTAPTKMTLDIVLDINLDSPTVSKHKNFHR